MRTEEDLCNESIEVEHTSEENEENAPVPITNDFRLLSLGCPLWLTFYEFEFCMKKNRASLLPL